MKKRLRKKLTNKNAYWYTREKACDDVGTNEFVMLVYENRPENVRIKHIDGNIYIKGTDSHQLIQISNEEYNKILVK